MTSLSVQTAVLLQLLIDRLSVVLSRNFRQTLQRNRTPLRSRWCRWRRRTSPWSRPPTRWTSAPWAASPETRTQRPILPNLQPAPPCQSPRCSRSCTVRENVSVIQGQTKDNQENRGINTEGNKQQNITFYTLVNNCCTFIFIFGAFIVTLIYLFIYAFMSVFSLPIFIWQDKHKLIHLLEKGE